MSRIARPFFAFVLLFVLAVGARANVLMQGFYWDVPSPAAGTPSAPWWWDKLGGQANAIRLNGFTGIWIPPVLKGSSGGYSVGYDPFDDYDLGSKNQMGTIPTRYGTREQLQKCCAMLRANSLEIYSDLVQNHRNGDPGNYSFSYLDAYGNAGGGRFGKGFYDFHPNVPQDPNVPDSGENFSLFGRDLAPINGPSQWVYNGLNNAGDWLTKALDLQGYRLDYCKGISTDWLRPFLNYGAMAGKFAVGEFWDSNLGSVQNWVNNMMQGRSSAFDFPLRDLLRNMCNSPGSFNMALLDHAGLAGVDPTHAVTFVENHDTDRSDPIYQNKALAYAYILTSEGYPSVFYKDWSSDAGCYNMGGTSINNLVWIHEKIASGTTTQRFKNNLVFVYERNGGNHLLVGLNNNTGYNYVLTCATGFGANVQLHDYTGHAADIWTDGSGNVTLNLPPAVNGMGYVCYSRTGISGGFTATQLATTQEYAGATDLDIKPADNTTTIDIGRVYVQAGKSISGALYYDIAGWTGSTNIYLSLDGPSGSTVTSKTYYITTPQGTTLTATASTTGFYKFRIRSFSTPASNPKPKYWLRATYTAPQT